MLKDHRNLLSAAQMRAKNRFADDSDAMTRMRVAMTALTNFMVRLLRKFPEAEKVARAILAAWETREGGVVSHNGQMLDQPVVERARRLIQSARA